ncbi:molybdopterin-guanine dinucleotide biosynthesis protein B [Sansalvadorimonas sp. 2012CJ34-2]|uniref:Molybdopterin-guanine dinucleotide biosynthesis protein B n=1 Tax=Parendozoicomonas callyspongiae TaxID=2942213 RepID=A0ABT0PJ32_9GAMM|nr:molybdopterin-guanine dinucleotide biosynthesis protein B [Sansalvadorimonas sp. 2012CJ34-2]MCL6271368.1 molybdopterin-guanine dinucleotide biosynthesis protein B [Sansalvadorimonas sp. 2012CJ34-2]
MNLQIPIIGFAAFSGTGKTTLLEKVLPLITGRGIKIGLVKASHHSIEPDKPGKDSYRLRKAGATQLVLSTPERAICITEREIDDPLLEDQLSLLDQDRLDLIIVEGFRDSAIPKIELHRSDFDRPFLYKNDTNIIALCWDCCDSGENIPLPQLDINNPEQVAEFVVQTTGLQQTA